MNKELTIEGNKAICEFMGIKWAVVKDLDESYWVIDTEKSHRFNEDYPVLYHSSWDWLMPVAIKLKIDCISTDINIAYNEVLEKIKQVV